MLRKTVNIVCLSVLLTCSCIAKVTPKPVQLHPLLRERLIIVPKGTDIGGYKAPDNGVFMTEDVFNLMIKELMNDFSMKNERYMSN